MACANNADPLLNHSVSNICTRIDELDNAAQQYTPEDPVLWRVPPSLHYVNPNAFTPITVAIAPLHRCSALTHNDGQYAYAFKHLERCKLIAARAVCSHLRIQGSAQEPSSFKSLAGALMSDNGIDKIRAFYSSEFNLVDVSDDQIASAFALDSCFIVEMMRCLSEDHHYSMVPGLGSAATEFSKAYGKMSYTTRDDVVQDLLLLESQLPLFVIKKVIELDGRFRDSNQTDADARMRRMIDSIASRALPFCKGVDRNNLGRSDENHLLECLYKIVTAPDEVDQAYAVSKSSPHGATDTKIIVPTATQLQSSGVVFVGHNGSLRRIAMERNKIILPIIHVGDETEKIFRNLLAHEATQRHVVDSGGAGTVLSYLHFMNSLINTADDVALLQGSGVLVMENVGDHESVAAMWNKLATNTRCVYTHGYRTVAGLVNEYSQNVMHSVAYEFKQRYFARPWLIVSLISGIVLLVMTFLTMFYTMELYYGAG